MNFADIWDTPGYFYALGYTLGTVVVLWFEGRMEKGLREALSCAALLTFLVPFSIATKGAWGAPFVLSMAAMVLAILGCVYLNVRDVTLALFAGGKAFIYGEFAASLCWQVYYGLAIRHVALQRWQWRAAFMLAAFAVIGGAFYLMERALHRERTAVDVAPRDLIVEAVIVLTVYVVSNLSYLDNEGLFSGSFARDVFAIRTLVDMSGVAMLYAFHRQLIEVQTRFENDTLHSIMQMQYQAYQLSQESIDMVNRKYHDLKHQIAVLRSEAASGRTDECLNQLERDIRSYEAQHQTGCAVLDAILASKSLYCQNHGIELKYIVDGRPLAMMEDMEVAALFGNMLDNAIESAEGLPDAAKRVIRLFVAGEKSFLRVRIENYCDQRLVFVDGMPVTTKRDKRYHGFGMKSMERICEKYGGTLTVRAENGLFLLDAVLFRP